MPQHSIQPSKTTVYGDATPDYRRIPWADKIVYITCQQADHVVQRRLGNRADCFAMSAMSSRRGFWSDLKTGRWVVVPGRFLLSLFAFPGDRNSGSLFSSHSLGSCLVAYKLDSFHPSHFISSPA